MKDRRSGEAGGGQQQGHIHHKETTGTQTPTNEDVKTWWYLSWSDDGLTVISSSSSSPAHVHAPQAHLSKRSITAQQWPGYAE